MISFSLSDMSVNSSTSPSDSIKTSISYPYFCFILKPGFIVYATSLIRTFLILLPLCIFILYVDLQRRRKQQSTPSIRNHSDSLIYHLVVFELFGVVGDMIFLSGISQGHMMIMHVGYSIWSLPWYGELFLNVLTSVEHYLAVVHPVTYLSLRSETGIRMRNISIGCVWLLSCAATCVLTLKTPSLVLDFSCLVFSVTVCFFCSMSVLCALIRTRPGKQGVDRERVDQSKQRAFFTITAILGVLMIGFLFHLLRSVLALTSRIDCIFFVLGAWFNLPSVLLLQLLYLQRAGVFAWWKNNQRKEGLHKMNLDTGKH